MKIIKLITSAIFVLILIGLYTTGVKWEIDLDTGYQSYYYSIYGIEIKSLRESEYIECGGIWQNPMKELSGVQTISDCNILSICNDADVSSSVISNGCKT